MPREPKPIRRKTLLVLLTVALALGSLYRFTDLGKKPMHTDEAILALKTQEYWQSGTFEYDPRDYHGPFLHHLTTWIGSVRGWTPESLNEEQIRWVVTVCGLLLIVSPLLFMDAIGRTGAGMAAIFLATSPMMTFYSRYYIMEVPFVLLVALFLAFCWRWAQRKHIVWLLLAGVALGFMHATKETFVLNLAALTAGWGVANLMGLSFTPKNSSLSFGSSSPKPQSWPPVVIVAATAAIVSVWMFSNGFKDWEHVKNSVMTYESYLGRSGGSGHEKPWHYYLTLLFWRRQAFLWSEALIGGLAVIGMLNAFLDSRRAEHKRAFLICFATYAVVLLSIYSVIPYKTPWSILGVAWALALLGGLGARTIFRMFSEVPVIKVALALLLAGGVHHLCRQTSLATDYRLPHRGYDSSEMHNPYVYSHTTTNLVQLARRIHELADKHPAGREMPVQVIQAEQGWPLPWYLRDMKRVGYQSEIPATLTAPVVVTDAEKEEAVLTRLGGNYESTLWGLRPGVTLCLLVDKSLALPETSTPPATTPVPAPPVAAALTNAVPPPVSALAPVNVGEPMPPALSQAAPANAESTTVPKAEPVTDEPELMGPPYPVPAIPPNAAPFAPAR